MNGTDNGTLEWMNGFHTANSCACARNSYSALTKYLETNSIVLQDWISSMAKNEDARYKQVNDFIKTIKSPATQRQYFSFIKNYLRVVHGIKMTIEDRKELVKFRPIQKINREPLTKKIIRDFVKNANKFHATTYLLIASSGMRISENLSLKKEDFDFKSSPVKVTIQAEYTKTKTERIAFVSNEAISYLNSIKDEYFQSEKMLIPTENYFNRLRKKLRYTETYPNTRNYKVNIHSMRAFFRTVAGQINQDFAEAMIGHEGYLSRSYVRLSETDKLNYYKKLEPALTIL